MIKRILTVKILTLKALIILSSFCSITSGCGGLFSSPHGDNNGAPSLNDDRDPLGNNDPDADPGKKDGAGHSKPAKITEVSLMTHGMACGLTAQSIQDMSFHFSAIELSTSKTPASYILWRDSFKTSIVDLLTDLVSLSNSNLAGIKRALTEIPRNDFKKVAAVAKVLQKKSDAYEARAPQLHADAEKLIKQVQKDLTAAESDHESSQLATHLKEIKTSLELIKSKIVMLDHQNDLVTDLASISLASDVPKITAALKKQKPLWKTIKKETKTIQNAFFTR